MSLSKKQKFRGVLENNFFQILGKIPEKTFFVKSVLSKCGPSQR